MMTNTNIPPTMKEAQLQKQILDYLRLNGCLAVKFNNGGVYIKSRDCYMKSPQKGISDIIALTKKGFYVAIEVKVGYNKPSEEQLNFLKEVRQRQGIGIWVKSLEEVVKSLKTVL